MSGSDDSPRFEQIDWDEVDGRGRSPERLALAAGVAVLLSVYVYDTYFTHLYLVGTWRVEAVDWVFLLAIVVLFAYGVVPAIRRREAARRVGSRLRSKPAALLAAGYLSLLAIVGVVGPAVIATPPLRFEHAFHPPVGFSSSVVPIECLGEVTGEAFERRCHWSSTYPLGTNQRGHPMEFLLVSGARVAVYVAVIIAAFVVPLAAAVGVVAGLRGGIVDDLLTSYVDVQLCIPAIVVYFVGYAYWNPSLLLLLFAFGLFSWGGIARLVRSEVLQRREAGHVLVARSLGASRTYIARRHVLPNVTNTLVPAVFQLLALLILVEAGVAFLGFHEIDLYSWGATISESIDAEVEGQMHDRAEHPAYRIWWVSTLPALALTCTMLALKLLGDGLRDALDPRGRN